MNEKDTPVLASPPCFAHELEMTEYGFVVIDPVAQRDVARWRKAERQNLIAKRLAIPQTERDQAATQVIESLETLVEVRPGIVIGGYWPFRGELDLRAWMTSMRKHGARVALPAVEAKDQPLVFREWTEKTKLERGNRDIPQPPVDATRLRPDVVVAPLVGYDSGCYRLGYGGGSYDRTLATFTPRPQVIGVAHSSAEISTIYPQPHDVPMDYIVTGSQPIRRRHG